LRTDVGWGHGGGAKQIKTKEKRKKRKVISKKQWEGSERNMGAIGNRIDVVGVLDKKEQTVNKLWPWKMKNQAITHETLKTGGVLGSP